MPKPKTKAENVVEKEEAVVDIEDIDFGDLDGVEDIDLGDLDASLSEDDINAALEGTGDSFGSSISNDTLNLLNENSESILRAVKTLHADNERGTQYVLEALREVKAVISQLKEIVGKFDARLSAKEVVKEETPPFDMPDEESAVSSVEQNGGVVTVPRKRGRPAGSVKTAEPLRDISDETRQNLIRIADKNKGVTASRVAQQLGEKLKLPTSTILSFFQSEKRVNKDGKLQ